MKIELVKAVDNDLLFLHNLRNNPADLKFSRRGAIPIEQIKKEFLDGERITFIAVMNGNNIGYVAFDKIDNTTNEINIAIIPECRNLGRGRDVLREATIFAINNLNVDRILACISKNNTASIKIFHSNFYNFAREDDHYTYLIYDKRSKNIVFAFDMDGVLVNSSDMLYEIYLNFASEFGISGNKTEFSILDGKTIPNVVRYLKDTHDIMLEYDKLLEIYEAKVVDSYSSLCIDKHTLELINSLKLGGIRVAIASSASKKIIDSVIENSNAKSFFDYMVCGDDVESAKPSPDIYEKIIHKFGKGNIYYAIEDSSNGVVAATDAGFKVIHINKFNTMQGKVMQTFSELQCSYVINKEQFAGKMIELQILDRTLDITTKQSDIIEKNWREAQLNRKLFNGKLLSYDSCTITDNKVIINSFITQYKYFLAQHKGCVELGIRPLAISGFMTDRCGNILVGRRNNVTQYDGCCELTPSGSVDPDCIKGHEDAFVAQLLQEMEEETGVKDIKSVEYLGAVLSDETVDVVIKVVVNDDFNKITSTPNDEYKNLKVLDFNDIFSEKWVPLSLFILSNENLLEHT